MSTGLAMFYLPEKLAMFVPVFAGLEHLTFGTPSARKRNIKNYLHNRIIPYFANDCQKLRQLFNDESEVNIIKKLAYSALELKQEDEIIAIGSDVLEDIFMFYDSGHSFYGWNFNNITKMLYLSESERQVVEKFRKHLIDEIENLYSVALPPDYF